MKKMIALSALTAILALPFMTSDASAGSCRNAIEQAKRANFGANLGKVCLGADKSVKENSPFVYVNPDGGCDIGLQMPGLPSFGIGTGSFDMCAMAKTVIGPMVGQVNSQLQQEMDGVINGINQSAQEAVGTNVLNSEINLGDMATDKGKEILFNR